MIPDGGPIGLISVDTHTFTVTSKDRAGKTHTQKAMFTVGRATDGATGPTDGTTGPNGTQDGTSDGTYDSVSPSSGAPADATVP